MNINRHHSGVTLIELMITMAVLAIVAAIAIPLYSNYITTSRTTEGWNGLASLKLAQEEFFLENNRYFPDPDGTSTTAGNLSTWWIPAEDNDGDDSDRNFIYSVTSSNTGRNYVITATGRGAGYAVPASVNFSLGN